MRFRKSPVFRAGGSDGRGGSDGAERGRGLPKNSRTKPQSDRKVHLHKSKNKNHNLFWGDDVL